MFLALTNQNSPKNVVRQTFFFFFFVSSTYAVHWSDELGHLIGLLSSRPACRYRRVLPDQRVSGSAVATHIVPCVCVLFSYAFLLFDFPVKEQGRKQWSTWPEWVSNLTLNRIIRTCLSEHESLISSDFYFMCVKSRVSVGQAGPIDLYTDCLLASCSLFGVRLLWPTCSPATIRSSRLVAGQHQTSLITFLYSSLFSSHIGSSYKWSFYVFVLSRRFLFDCTQ